MTRKAANPAKHSPDPTQIVACNRKVDIGTPVIRWHHKGGFACPNKRGRSGCTQHDPELNDAPTQAHSAYRITDPKEAYQQLSLAVYQLVLHYDVCFTSWHCHQVLKDSSFKGSHFYLDLDGTLYQTCDLYWKTNTAPADDKRGNDRAVHVEMANLSWQALAKESDLYQLEQDAYVKRGKHWVLDVPDRYRKKMRNPNYRPIPARVHGTKGYFTGKVNGRQVRMWDFTEAQYQALFKLCRGIQVLLPGILPEVPTTSGKRSVPLDVYPDFAQFRGVLGHAHIQGGTPEGIKRKYDPGPAFDWQRLKQFFKNPALIKRTR